MKLNPYALPLKTQRTITKTFTHYPSPRYTCSCGVMFDNEDAECPKAIAGQQDSHIVASADPLVSFGMTFRVLSRIEILGLNSMVDDMVRRYVTGTGEPGKKGYIAPDTLPPVQGQPVIPSETVCRIACTLWRAQLMPEGEFYSFEELVAWMACDSICDQMVEAYMEVQGVDLGNDPLAS